MYIYDRPAFWRRIGETTAEESPNDFTLTHVFVAGPGSRCSEPVRSGLVFVSDQVPSIEESKRHWA